MAEFHFLRPWWLLLLPIAAFCYWFIRAKPSSSSQSQKVIAAHLLNVLVPKQTGHGWLKPIDLTAILTLIVIFAAAGPSWYKAPVNDVKPTIAIILKATKAMQVNDLSPNRLQRAKQKINDLLKFRAPAKTAFYVYSSSSHRVLPFSEDHSVFAPFIDAIAPQIMPDGGPLIADDAANAIAAANKALLKQGTGTIVVLADDFSKVQVRKINALGIPFVWWQFATDTGGVIIDAQTNMVSNLDSATIIKPANNTAKMLTNAAHVSVTLTSQDLLAIDQLADSFAQQTRLKDSAIPFKDMAWYLIWPALLLNLLWFRRGWTSSKQLPVSCILIPLVSLSITTYSPTSHAAVIDWFLTPDQQAMIAFNNKDYAKAASLFTEPYWQASALYEQGKYQQAATIFASLNTADGFYNRGNALLKALNYQPAINAYETALKMQPDHKNAAYNLVLAKKALKLTMQAGTGVDAEKMTIQEVDGNKVTEDKEAKSQQYRPTDQLDVNAKERWMRSVDAKMSDFLKTKFATQSQLQEQR